MAKTVIGTDRDVQIMTVIQIGSYRLKCEGCKVLRSDVGFSIDKVYLWSNQHGCKIRLFCHLCGDVHDVTIKSDNKITITKHAMKASIFEPE